MITLSITAALKQTIFPSSAQLITSTKTFKFQLDILYILYCLAAGSPSGHLTFTPLKPLKKILNTMLPSVKLHYQNSSLRIRYSYIFRTFVDTLQHIEIYGDRCSE